MSRILGPIVFCIYIMAIVSFRWGIRFEPHNLGADESWLLEDDPAHRIILTDYPIYTQMRELLILKKAQQTSGGNCGQKIDSSLRYGIQIPAFTPL
jgi:hypothetical protein